jgi:hypothetical protein
MDDQLDDILDDAHPDRRTFVKRVVRTTAFAVPLIASYDLQTLSASAFPVQGNQSNQISPP